MKSKSKNRDMEHLRIAMLGHKTMPARDSSRGGIEVVVEELATRMAAQGHDVTCYNRTGCDNGGLKEYKGVRLKSVFTIHRKGLAAMTSSVFAALCAAFGKYDVVHFHAEGPCVMLWLPKLMGKRCIATIHGLDWQREKWREGIGSKYIKLGEKTAVKFADKIIVLSKGVQEYFWKTYQRETIFIPNGVSRPKKREANEITEKFGLNKDSYILFLGRIVPEKGLRYLIEAFKNVDTKKKLVIAGDSSDTGKFTRDLKEMAKVDSRIIFTGFVTGKIREELYSNAYVYVLPSDLEGMPLSLLEALSFGNCCLISDIAECTSVVEKKAVWFKRGDTYDLKEKIQMLCNDADQVNEYKKIAAEYVLEQYSWDDVAKKTVGTYVDDSALTKRN